MGVTKAASPSSITVGANVTFTMVVTNHGPAQAINVLLTDTLPAGLTRVSSTSTQGSCTGSATVSCAIGTLNKDQSATVTLVATATTAGTITNTAAVGATNPDPNVGANNRGVATITVTGAGQAARVADLELEATGPVTGKIGKNLVYTFTITNNGPAPATDVELSTKLTTGSARLVSAPGCTAGTRLTCRLGTLAPGASRTVRIILRARRTGAFVNEALAERAEPDPVAPNNRTVVRTRVSG